MLRTKRMAAAMLGVSLTSIITSLALMIGCGRTDSGAQSRTSADDKVLNLYDWADDVAPDTISSMDGDGFGRRRSPTQRCCWSLSARYTPPSSHTVLAPPRM
jgi:hypothetical protein